jgi:hypothetical protein
VLGNARPVVGGSASQPWADIKMRTNGPRAEIVYKVLNTILDSEMPGVAKVIAATLQALLAGAVSIGGRSKRLTLAGSSSSLASPQAAAARTAHGQVSERRQTARDQSEDDRVRITENRPGARAQAQSRLKRTHATALATAAEPHPSLTTGIPAMSAAHYRYKKDSLTWTPAGEGAQAVDIEGVQSIRFGQAGETTKLMSDASENVQELPLHSILSTGTVTTLSQVAAELVLGAGVLAWTMERVKTGRGAVSGEDKEVSLPNAVLRAIDSGAGSQPGENTTLAFEGAEDDNGDVLLIGDAEEEEEP